MLDLLIIFFLAGLSLPDEAVVTPSPVASIDASHTEVSDHILLKPTMTDEKLLQAGPVKDNETVAVIHTNYGDITIRFFPDAAPKAVENFIGLSKKDYYDGVIFHRVIDGFMIQGGDPEGTGRGGKSLWGKPFDDEFADTAKNNIGAVSMANAGPKTNGSQFFINTANNNYLDNRHSVFGEVISGMNIVNAISKVKTDSFDKPVTDVVMNDIEILPYNDFKAKYQKSK